MSKFDLVIFDCDGVLLDSELISCGVDAEAYSKAGYAMTTNEVAMRFAGVPGEVSDAIIAQEMGKPLPDGFRANLKEVVLARYRDELEPIPGAKTLLSSLVVAKCVASSAAPSKLALGLILTEMFELVYPNVFSANLVSKGKPHPDVFLYAAEKMNVLPSRCVVIEDSVAGVAAAKTAGMTCIGFTGASHCFEGHSDRLTKAGADFVVNRMDAIPALLEG
ncbi:HAD family hydrolase [Halocynthiibacter namhaensis]|uniref:HAD family hydrolase n=1 Tax=Halocynthiibacter namhaensis TaxID=1290553 RepID=UPI0005798398|nr:HAD family phosphatase [Halocynthiibacter namhaensis]